MTGSGVGGFGGSAALGPAEFHIRDARKDRQEQPRIWFWHDLFDYINHAWFMQTMNHYPWTNADRKILANLSRKYGVPRVMSMWDFYFNSPGGWYKKTGGRVYGMARDGGRLRDLPGFAQRARMHEIRLNEGCENLNAAQILDMVGL